MSYFNYFSDYKYIGLQVSSLMGLLFLLPFTLNAQNRVNVNLEGVEVGDSVLVIAQMGSKAQIEKWALATETSTSVQFNLLDGKWAIMLDATGYSYPRAQVFELPGGSELTIELSKFNSDDYIYEWYDDESYVGHATQTYQFEPSKIVVIDDIIEVPSDYSAISLRNKFGIILSNQFENWSSASSYSLFKTLSDLPSFKKLYESETLDFNTGENVQAIFKLTNQEIQDDISIEVKNGIEHVTISRSAFTYAEPMTVLLDGIKGRYFSKRLSRALINYLTDFGVNSSAVNDLANQMFGLEFLGSSSFTEEIMGEDASNFQEFHAWEKVEILSMIHEYPSGMHKQEGLKYLVRRVNGQDNPIYPLAPAIAWVGGEVIEFMSKAFNSTAIEHVRRLILHEKAHFLWQFTINESLKNKWIKIGGWYEDPTTLSGWSTTNTTEFASAYAHAKNPDEDMAESISFYITNPEGLKSRSIRKFEFIRDFIMHGTQYVAQIREDLTFTVYNLFPDYVYPGKVIGSKIEITGAPEEDKTIRIEFKLNSTDPTIDGASGGQLRLVSKAGTLIDFFLEPKNGTSDSIMVATGTMNNTYKAGYWTLSSLYLTDDAGNKRYENTSTLGFKFYLNNPFEDLNPPFYNNDFKMNYVSSQLEFSDGNGIPYKAVRFQTSFYDENQMGRVLVNVYFPNVEGSETKPYEIQIQKRGDYPGISQEPNSDKQFTLYLPLPEYYPSGTYSVSQLTAVDIAGNYSRVYMVEDTANFYLDDGIKNFKDIRQNIEISTLYPDYLPPELEVDSIFVTAVPSNTTESYGETVVSLRMKVRDHSDYLGEESGLRRVMWTLRNPQGSEFGYDSWNTNLQLDYHSNEPVEGANKWRWFEFSNILPAGSVPGKWGISSIQLQDRANNFKNYSFVEYIQFNIIDSPIELTEPLAVSFKEEYINAIQPDSVSFEASCSPCSGLTYKYSIFSDGGGKELTGSGVFSSDTVSINDISISEVIDGNLNLTVQVVDIDSQLVTTSYDRIIKDKVVPIDYGYKVDLDYLRSDSSINIDLSLSFNLDDSAGTYSLILNSKTSNVSAAFTDTIRTSKIDLENILLNEFPDGKIDLEMSVVDKVGNVGEKKFGQLIKRYNQVRILNEFYTNLHEPVIKQKGSLFDIIFSWEAANSATKYDLELSNDVLFQNVIENSSTIDTALTISSSLERYVRYYWRVRGSDNLNNGMWSFTKTLSSTGSLFNSVFSTTIEVTNARQDSISLSVGMVEGATSGYDAEFDQLAPPAPPTGSFDARIRFNDQDYFTFFQPPAQDSISWPLLVRPGTGFAPLTLQWDPTTLPKEGAMTLSWQAGDTPMRVNMRTLSSIQLHAEAETALTLVYQPTTQVDVSYQAGWNMLGLPVSVEHQNYLELFPLAQTNSLFGYTNSYVESDRFTQGNGYWLRFEDAGTQSLKGYPVEEIEVEVGAGWNLISGNTHTGEIADTTGLIVSGTLFGYKGAYYSASALKPGQAYWVVASDSGAIRVTSSPAAKTYAKEGHEALTTVPNELYRIQVSTGEGYERALYVVEAYEAEQEHPLRYALPPVPPSGSFDVRFTDGRWVSVDEVVEILVQQPSGAVSVSVSSSEGDAWVMDEYSGAELVRRTSLSDGESLALLQQTTRILGGPAKVMTSREQPEASLPEEFALEQNYPNPFNPSTQIRYGIPQASEVELTVFNMLGQKVTTLVNQKQSAGWHMVTFDASGLSSGFYIYRIQAGSFVSTKKLMLIK